MTDTQTAVDGAKLYKSLQTILSLNDTLSNEQKRKIVEMAVEDEL